MADVITDVGRDIIEEIVVGESSAVLDEIAVGNATSGPSTSDTSMTSELHSADSSSSGVSATAGTGTGELQFDISVTGGTEVPADAEITEIGIKASDGTLVYHEIRSTAIDVPSGVTKTIEVKLFVKDEDPGETGRAIIDSGRELIADILLGNSAEFINTIAVGSSTNEGDVDSSDSGMFDEVYRDDDSQSNITLASTTNVGEIDAIVTLSAGNDASDEVSGGTDISEFGIFTDANSFIFHEIRNTVTLQAGDTKTFKIPFTIVQ